MKNHIAPMAVVAAVGLAVVISVGCKPKAPASDQPVAGKPAATTLQAELSNLGGLVFEPDPARRPLVISEPASSRREWALKALNSGYRASGHANLAWDRQVAAAFEAFADYTRVNASHWPALEAALAELARVGCDDPMVQYLQVRYGSHAEASEQVALEFFRAHDAMLRSKHHPLFKFMAGMRAVDHARSADKKSNRSDRISWTTICLEDTARDTNAPSAEVTEAVSLWLKHSPTQAWIDYVKRSVGAFLPPDWAPTADFWPALQGRASINEAWARRGTGYAKTVSNQGWQGFEDELVKAEEFLTEAWSKNPSNAETAFLMMRVELGQGRGRARMEAWFERAMSLDTNYYDAANLMSFYLEPRWYGSDAEAIRFARSCVASDQWGGTVPLVLADLHRSLAKFYYRTNAAIYWQQPQVWPDVKSSWEKFFQINPGATGWRHNYARDAFNCGQYSVFLAQTKLFAGNTNHTFFGGRTEFDAMLKKAQTSSDVPTK